MKRQGFRSRKSSIIFSFHRARARRRRVGVRGEMGETDVQCTMYSKSRWRRKVFYNSTKFYILHSTALWVVSPILNFKEVWNSAILYMCFVHPIFLHDLYDIANTNVNSLILDPSYSSWCMYIPITHRPTMMTKRMRNTIYIVRRDDDTQSTIHNCTTSLHLCLDCRLSTFECRPLTFAYWLKSSPISL